MFLLEGFEVSGLFSWSINFLMFINSWKAWGRCFVESRAKCRWFVGEVVIKVEVKIGEGVGMPAVSIFEHRTHVSIWLYIEKQTNLKIKTKNQPNISKVSSRTTTHHQWLLFLSMEIWNESLQFSYLFTHLHLSSSHIVLLKI